MRWRKRDVRKAGIALAGMLLLLVLIVWVPVSAADAYEVTPGPATSVTATVQASPTADTTMTALQEEKLRQDINQSQHSLHNLFWNGLTAFISALLVVLGGLLGFARWLREQGIGREKRDEDRFQSAIQGLGGNRGQKIGGAVMLRTFLLPGYEKYYSQVFDLAVVNLRTPVEPASEDNPGNDTSDNFEPPNSQLRQALSVLFKEAFPLVREQYIKRKEEQQRAKQRVPLTLAFLKGLFTKMFRWFVRWLVRRQDPDRLSEKRLNLFKSTSLDASDVKLDKTFLYEADLRKAYLRSASLRSVRLEHADFGSANLEGADLEEVDLRGASLEVEKLIKARCLKGVNLSEQNFEGKSFSSPTKVGQGQITLERVQFESAKLSRAQFYQSTLINVNFKGAELEGVNFQSATLTGVDLTGVDLEGVHFEDAILTGVDLTDVRNLYKATWNKAKLKGVKGQNEEQLKTLNKEKGAIIINE